MPDPNPALQGASPRRRFVNAACGFDEDDRGGCFWHLQHGHAHRLRARPASLLRKSCHARVWRGSLHLPFELSLALQELQADDDVAAGRATLASFSLDCRPVRRPYRARRRQALRRFFADVPQAVQQALRGFTQGSYPLFRLLMSCPAALDLMASDDGAALAWCLANAHELRPRIDDVAEPDLLRRARAQTRSRRRDALAFVGLPTTKAALHALSKVPRAALDAERVHDVIRVLSSPVLSARARHLPVWNHVLDLLTDELHAHVDDAFLLAVAAEPAARRRWPTPVAHELRETLQMLQGCGLPAPVFHSPTQLRTVHDDALRRTRPLRAGFSTAPFPPCPVALTERELRFATPLVDGAQLVREGRQMHHCLGSASSHHLLARTGRFFAFALTKPARLTLAVVWSEGAQRWRIYDLRGPANGLAPDTVHAFVDDVLDRFARSGPPPLVPPSAGLFAGLAALLPDLGGDLGGDLVLDGFDDGVVLDDVPVQFVDDGIDDGIDDGDDHDHRVDHGPY